MADSEIELDAETGDDEPKKKQKVLQKYLPGYQIKYPVIRRSSVSDNHAYCTVCRLSLVRSIRCLPSHNCIFQFLHRSHNSCCNLVVTKNCCKIVKLADSISLPASKAHLAVIPGVPF